jgi:hypothetical protein
MSERSIARSRVPTMTLTIAIVKRVWVAMTLWAPSPSRGAPDGMK